MSNPPKHVWLIYWGKWGSGGFLYSVFLTRAAAVSYCKARGFKNTEYRKRKGLFFEKEDSDEQVFEWLKIEKKMIGEKVYV